MSFFNIFKVLFERLEHDGRLGEMDRLLGEKLKSIEQLRMKKNYLFMEYSFAKMENYTLSNILQHALYRKNYAERLEAKLDELLRATLKLGFVLERVQWHKLLNYDALMNAERRREFERIQREMRELHARMESRKIVVELRQEQRKKAKLMSFLDDCKKAAAKQTQLRKRKIDCAIKKRNEYILELVKGAKVLEQLRLKIEQKKSEIKNTQRDSQSLMQRISFNSNEKLLDSINDSLLQPAKRTFEEKRQPEAGFKPLKTTLKFTFNAFNFEQFDLKRIQEQQESVKAFENNFHISMPSVYRDFMSNSIESGPSQGENMQNNDVLPPKLYSRNYEKQNPTPALSLSNESGGIKKGAERPFFLSLESTAPEPMMIDKNGSGFETEEGQAEKDNAMPLNREDKQKPDIPKDTPSSSVTEKESVAREQERRTIVQKSRKGEGGFKSSSKANDPLRFGMDIFMNLGPGFESGDSKAIMFSDQDNPSVFSEASTNESEVLTEMDIERNKQQDIL